jgi:hypothetical protein
MKQLEVFKKIGGILNELHEQYKYIETNPGNINDLELELFVANAHFLTDHAEILNKLNQRNKLENTDVKPVEKVTQQLPPHIEPVKSNPPQVQITSAPQISAPQTQAPPVVQPERPVKPLAKNAEQVERALAKIKELTAEKFFEPVVQQPKRDVKSVEIKEEQAATESDVTAAPKDNYVFEREEPKMIRHELVVDEDEELYDDDDLPEEDEIIDDEEEATQDIQAVAKEEAPAEVVKEDIEERIAIELGKDPVIEPAKPELKIEPPVKEKDEVFTINQRISAQLGNTNNVSEQANAQPVTNLKQAITLNDKLLYIKDLFNGYSLAYSEAIEILNRFNTFEEANRFLNKNYTTKNNWDSKPDTTAKFFALLKRRYS